MQCWLFYITSELPDSMPAHTSKCSTKSLQFKLIHPIESGIAMKQKIWYTYDDIHRVIKALAEKIQNSGVKYDAMIAIGGGGFIPARMLRCFLEIPI